jgi:hypothetical protein
MYEQMEDSEDSLEIKGFHSLSQLGGRFNEVAVKVTTRNCPFHRYNYFLSQYNNPTNKVNNIALKRVPAWRLMDIVSPWLLALSIVLCFIPFICFLMLILALARFFSLAAARIIVANNRRRVPNPFVNMIHTEKIYQLNCYIEVSTEKELVDFISNDFGESDEVAITEKIRKGKEQNEKTEVMLYQTEFKRYEQKVMDKFYRQASSSLIMCCISAFMSYTTIFTILL